MTRTIRAEYLADEQKLKLAEPLEGVSNHASVTLTLEADDSSELVRPWLALAGSLSPAVAEEWRSLIENDRSDE